MQHMQESQRSYVQAVEALAMSVARLENTINTWESAYLPQMLRNVPMAPSHTPEVPTPTVLGTQDYQDEDMNVEQTMNSQSESQQAVTQEHHVELPSMQRLQDRSLRHCCERVVQTPFQAGRPREALRPFRARS